MGPISDLGDTVIGRKGPGYATAVTFLPLLLGVFVTCHNVADVTIVSLFTFILGFLQKLPVPLEITV